MSCRRFYFDFNISQLVTSKFLNDSRELRPRDQRESNCSTIPPHSLLYQGAFNNYVDRIMPFFAPPPPLRGHFLYPERGQKQTFFDPFPLILSTQLLNGPLVEIKEQVQFTTRAYILNKLISDCDFMFSFHNDIGMFLEFIFSILPWLCWKRMQLKKDENCHSLIGDDSRRPK